MMKALRKRAVYIFLPGIHVHLNILYADGIYWVGEKTHRLEEQAPKVAALECFLLDYVKTSLYTGLYAL